MARNPYDPLSTRKRFDSMMGPGSFESGISRAREIGAGIGKAKLAEKEAKRQSRLLEAAAKEAAKKERERKEKAEREKKKGKKENTNSKQVENKRRQIEKSGGDADKKQSAIGKALNLDPDNGLVMDILDIWGRPMAGVNAAQMESEKSKGMQKAREAKKKGASDTEIRKILNENEGPGLKDLGSAFMKGLKGEARITGTEVAKERGLKGKAALASGLANDLLMDPLNFTGGLIGKGIGVAARGAGKTASKVPGVQKAATATADTVGSLFSRNRMLRKTLDGQRSDNLIGLDRNLRNRKNSMREDAFDNIAKAGLVGGKGTGTKVGEYMERGLRRPGPLDISTAPNVMNPTAALNAMPKPGTSLTNPIGQMRDIATDTTTSFNRSGTRQVDAGAMGTWGDDVSSKEVKDWLKANNLPGGTTPGRVSQFNKELYKTENAQQLSAVHNTRTKMTQVLKSTNNTSKATEELMKEPSVRANIKQAAETLTSGNKAITDFAKENGIDIDTIEYYLAHFATKEAKKWLDESGETISSGASKVGGNSKAVTRNIQDGVKNANIKMKKPSNIDEFFHTDAFTASAGGTQRAINFVMAEVSKKKVLEMPDFAKEIGPKAKPRKGNALMEIDGKRYEMTKGAADVIKNFDNVMEDDEGIKKFVKGFDKLQNLWKKTALFSAGFHMRSLAGNTWNMYLSGMNPAEATAKQAATMGYLKELRAVRTGRKNTDPFKDLDPLVKKATGSNPPKKKNVAKVPDKIVKQYDEFINQGLRNTGSGADLMDNAEDAMKEVRFRQKGTTGKALHEFAEIFKADGIGGKVKQAANSAFDTSKRLGDEIDEVARFTLFRNAMDKGMSAKQAAEKVREVLYDYTDLTQFERRYAKRAMPFYTFMRKNAEFQIKAFSKNPEKFSKLNMVSQNAKDSSDLEGRDTDVIPEYLREAFAMPLAGAGKMLNLALPASDMNRLTNPGKMALDSLTPLAKVPLEMITGNRFLDGRPIKDFEGQNGKLLGKEFGGALGMDGKEIEYLVSNLAAPIRNISGAQQNQSEGTGNLKDNLFKAMGGELAKPYDVDKLQNSADYRESQRLSDVIKRMRDQEEKEVMTLEDMKKQGIPTNEEEDAQHAFLKERGYEGRQRDLLLSLKNKVYNGNAETAAEARQLLQSMGIDPEVIDMVTEDYLDY